MTIADAAPNATQTVRSLGAITRERFWTKVWRTLVGLGIGALLYFVDLDAGVEKWGWVAVGVMVAGEWIIFPFRLLGALAVDVIAPAIRSLRAAWKGQS